eukprot:TRINITY_DN1443_c0_g1_i2.p2 TRINITY_DN1443_c0_g1~~TRINITY_DN1443_c0_g1_i2.p2  ORF type:complete len:125 (-),score=33.95 TRINITY_DN1443_c0_g1_i2:72-446(-)
MDAVNHMVGGHFKDVDILHALMEEIYPPVLALARQHNIPILDLPRTFDIHNADLYECQIEPSESGGQLIAEMVTHILNEHDFDGQSRFYFKGDEEIESEQNTDDVWRVDATADFTPNLYLKQLI